MINMGFFLVLAAALFAIGLFGLLSNKRGIVSLM